ncbi:DNA ligase D [Erythrobacter neustonensis]|uniref:DNA ligase (ATP) n=1 Tax=Erythrobacter neustonensis TaxID=1112 RepID=A0A192D4M7_9SPHN|nr:DNA ligase D [Erythrobacter neustonensis]ANK12734.1 ATP-dependent DNA ligase [Erythrobacter neustonensis]
MGKRSDPLASYNAKRDFTKTAEPKGEVPANGGAGGRRFIVQKHAASRLHWDLRLEIDGVLKSWAVTKGPSRDPAVKRLAVRTEDHPLSYAQFEGTIPAREYGGGTVMLWDRGTWAPIAGKSAADLEDGHLHFTLDGERMKGEWLLIRLKPRPGEKRENWLLRKIGDDHAAPDEALVEHHLTSVSTGRSMAEIAAGTRGSAASARADQKDVAAGMAKATKPGAKRPRRRLAAKLPGFRAPQLATLVDAVPTGNGWMHEIKFDGYRALIAARGEDVRVFTRSGQDWTAKFGPLVAAIAALDLPAALIDGEIVAHDAVGNPDFSALQALLKRGRGAQGPDDSLAFYAFDLLEADGVDLTALANIERKERLEALLAAAEPPIHVADHVIGAGEQLLRAMCGAGQEGIISKAIDAPYLHKRSHSWVKVKCIRRQEFVIVGWKASTTNARPFASLLLAQHEDGSLAYKGNVGTGFGDEELGRMAARLRRLERKTPPLDVDRAAARGVTWVKPALVAEIAFAEFTAQGRVRHASFAGLRADKPAREVASETPAPPPVTASDVDITNRDRVIFPDTGQTKGELADYYAAIAPAMLPFVAERPVSLVRCPQGRARKCFFQKHDSGALGDAVRHVPIRQKDGGSEDYLFVTDQRGILQCVQMGTIEFHAWGSRVDAVDQPERMIFDLDPDEGLDFEAVKRAATEIRAHLADLGLISFAMLSGGKGVHVVIPLTPGHDWDTHKDFARRFAEALSLAAPDRFTATMSKARRSGKIFIDWLRNQRGATAVIPFSARARAGAPVAVPIAWDELAKFEDAHPFAIGDAEALLHRAKSPALQGWGFAAQSLPAF